MALKTDHPVSSFGGSIPPKLGGDYHPVRLSGGHPSLNKEGIERIKNFLRENHLEAFLVLTKINRQYLSGFTGSAGVLLITLTPALSRSGRGGVKGELFVDDRYWIRARRESWLPVHPLTRLSATLSQRERGKGVRIGIEDRITLREAARLEKDYPKAQWVATQDIVEDLRAVKSREELKNIEKGSRIIDATFGHVVKILKNHPHLNPLPSRERKKSITEIEIAQEIEKHGKKLGADGLAFDPIVAWGANAAAPHHQSSNTKIGKNNFLLLDFGMMVGGYHSDFTRTLFIGNPDKKQEKVYNTVLEAQKKAIKKISIGVRAFEVDAAVRRFIGQLGFGKYFTHNTGHGVGLEIHESPNFSAKSEDVLRTHMVVTVEPGIYIEKWGGVRIEDMIAVGKKSRVMSRVPKDLKSMII